MAKFCTKCGKALSDGERCSCREPVGKEYIEKGKSLLVKVMQRTGIGTSSNNAENIFEKEQQIVPDIIATNNGEVPVKQYEAASLRSRIRGQHAKGRLQVTNKRVIFRAAGISYQGPIAQQYEFAINEIAGIEIKKKNRISAMNVFLCIWLDAILTALFGGIFSSFAEKAPAVAMVCATVLAITSAVPFFVLHKKFWIKLLSLCCGIGALFGTANISNLSPAVLLFGFQSNLADYCLLLVYILWLINMLLVCIVPELVLIVKTKGASPAFEIRRKQFPSLFRQMVEYTDFSEVLPGEDTDLMISELGALIDDIQTLGDYAIEKWKENTQ